MGKKCVVFVDDLNLPQVDASESIPAVELLRQVRVLPYSDAVYLPSYYYFFFV